MLAVGYFGFRLLDAQTDKQDPRLTFKRKTDRVIADLEARRRTLFPQLLRATPRVRARAAATLAAVHRRARRALDALEPPRELRSTAARLGESLTTVANDLSRVAKLARSQRRLEADRALAKAGRDDSHLLLAIQAFEKAREGYPNRAGHRPAEP
jgi:hypothetical protein